MAERDEHNIDEHNIKLGRYYVNVPSEVVPDFCDEMDEEVRSGPDLIAYIIVQHYRRKRRLKLAESAKAAQQTEERLPAYGPKPVQKANERVGGSKDEV